MGNKNCINCEAVLTGAFCVVCGQKAEIQRITTKSFFNNYVDRIFGFDTKFLRTIKDLTIHPGIVVRSFIEGNRVRYIDPVGYFFIITTLFLLSFALLNVDIKGFMESTSSQFIEVGEELNERQLASQKKFIQFISNNIRVTSFLIIPFIGIMAKLFYKKSGLNFLEHVTNAFYIQGHLTFLNIASVVIFSMTSLNTNSIIILAGIPYFA